MNDDAFGITLLINAADLCKADPVCVGGVCILLPPGFTRIEDCSLTSNYWRVGVGVNEGGSQAFSSTEEEGVAGEGTGSAESEGEAWWSLNDLARKAGPWGVRMEAAREQNDKEAGKLSPRTEGELQAPEPGHSAGPSLDSGLSCHSEMLPETGLCLSCDHTGLAVVP